VIVPVHRSSGAVVQAVRRLDAAEVAADDVALRRPTLDDVFLTLTGRAATSDVEDGAARRVA
jgi:ABC-2 type transport system ATP-binding protein